VHLEKRLCGVAMPSLTFDRASDICWLGALFVGISPLNQQIQTMNTIFISISTTALSTEDAEKAEVLKRYLESEALRVGRLMNLQVRGSLDSDSRPIIRRNARADRLAWSPRFADRANSRPRFIPRPPNQQ